MLIDTHAHLYYENLLTDISNILERAADAGVSKIIAPAVDLKTADTVLKLADDNEMIYAAVGFHPCDLKGKKLSDIKTLEEFLRHDKVIAVGEIGLDYYWNKENKPFQKSFFIEQLNLASDKDLPVIIHTRDSIKDAISVIKKYRENISGQFHCFSGDDSDLGEILALENFYLSFCGNITFKKFSGLGLIKKIPESKLLAETDSPFLTPEPFRGKQNEPAKIIYTVRKIAEIKESEYMKLAEKLTENTLTLFKKIK